MRKRPWLIPSLGMLAIGILGAVTSEFGDLKFWAGVAMAAVGLCGALILQINQKRERDILLPATGACSIASAAHTTRLERACRLRC